MTVTVTVTVTVPVKETVTVTETVTLTVTVTVTKIFIGWFTVLLKVSWYPSFSPLFTIYQFILNDINLLYKDVLFMSPI